MKFRTGLLETSSILAAAVPMLAMAPASAMAQDIDPSPAEAAEEAQSGNVTSDKQIVITVTGTRIEGIDPVGSVVIDADREDLAKAGNGSTADFLRQIPQVLSFGGSESRAGGAGFQGADVNVSFANSVNLRGLGTAATLNLVNNHRIPAMGNNSDLFEPDVIPAIALSQIQIVADGASAIYGSDAVTGVVNYIMRSPFNGFEVSGRVGYAEDRMDWKGSAIFGRKWSTGGIMLAYEHIHRDRLEAKDRASLYNDDFSAYGGSPLPSASAPGNIFDSEGVQRGIPAGMATSLTLGDLLPTTNRLSAWAGADALPKIDSNSVVGRFEQEIGSAVTFYGDGYYYKRKFDIDLKAYATAAAPLSVPSTNPYSPCNPDNGPFDNDFGIDCSSDLLVNYNFLGDIGPQMRSGYEKSVSGTLGFKVDLPYEWKADIYASRGQSKNWSYVTGTQIKSANLAALLAGPMGDIPAFNPFCDGTLGCNDPATIDAINTYNYTSYQFDRTDVNLTLNGPVFDLPGGTVRLAVGGEWYKDEFQGEGGNNNFGFDLKNPTKSPGRKVKAAFGEIYIPIVGDDNAMSGIQSLEFTAALRHEDYSDFGTTTNPKFGLNWTPVEGLQLHASYGKSFHAPVLSSNNPTAQAGTLSVIPISSDALAGTGFTGSSPVYVPTYIIGGNATLQPEKATTWSLGADFRPEALPGFSASVNYYNIEYTNRIDYPAYNAGPAAAISSDYFSPYVIRNPRFFTEGLTLSLEEFDGLVAAIVNGTEQPDYSPYDTVTRIQIGAPLDAETTIAIIDARRNNTGITKTDGFDLTAFYDFSAGNIDWTVGGVATYVLSYENSVAPGAPSEDQVNQFGAPLRFQGRGQIGATMGGLTTTLFVNFANAYSIPRRYIPAAADDRYLKVDSYTTFDLSLNYTTETESAILKDTTFTFVVQNLFDADPPFVLNSSSSANFPGVKFDSSRASPLGRSMSLQVTKAF